MDGNRKKRPGQDNGPVLGLILKGYPRISETFISNEILLLEKAGLSLHLFPMRGPRETFAHESVREIKAPVDYLPERMLPHFPKLVFHNLLLAGERPKRYSLAFKTALRRYSRTKRVATIKHLLQAGYLVRHLMEDSRVVHLHAHFAHSPTSVAMFASQLSGIPFSFTAHAKDIYTSDRVQLLEKMMLSSFVITCTEYNRCYLLGLVPGREVPIHRIYHGIDVDLFSHTERVRAPSPPYRILTVARITEKKGLATVYGALRHLLNKGVSVRHTLIGDGEDRAQVLSIIEGLGLKGVTHWLGTQPHGRVLEHYRRSDLFVLGCEVASNGDRDGIPNVLLESMAMGVPVVTTSVSAIPELIEDGKTGLLVPPRQPQAMAQAMERLLEDRDLRTRVIAGAKKRVLTRFDNKILVRDLIEIFKGATGVWDSG
ncbi:MAG: glycosyltransferase [Deltaproteobacteria bacterium]|nr:glycosyltransferase [Deltaproteobacteria bacterium]MBW2063787.1 glycosyltransferase [Deltaproteobacteria bacterium]